MTQAGGPNSLTKFSLNLNMLSKFGDNLLDGYRIDCVYVCVCEREGEIP